MIKQKKTMLIGGTLVAAAAGAFALYAWTGRQEESAIERWIGTQIAGVIESHLNCDASFGTLDYQAPTTVEITLMTMNRENQEFLGADRLLIELGEIPSLSKPIQIKRVEADGLRMYFKKAAGGGFVGWNGLVKPKALADPEAIEQGRRLSDVLVLRHVEVNDGSMIYDPADGNDPMVLEGVEFAMNTTPAPNEPGWYTLDCALGREGLSRVDFNGRINLDTAVLDIKTIDASIDIGPDRYATMPPAIQSLLRKHDVRGALKVNVSGRVPLKEFQNAELNVDAVLTDAFASADDYILPLEKLSVSAKVADHAAAVAIDANIMDGVVACRANAGLDGPMPITATWEFDGIQINRAQRASSDKSNQLAGKAYLSGQAFGRLSAWPASIDGSGNLRVDEGNLTFIPGVKELVRMVKPNAQFAQPSMKHRVTGQFALQSSAVSFEQLQVETDWLTARARGQVYYNGTLDMRVNAGPLEKLQSKMGKIGKIFGQLTDKIVTYRIQGPVNDPSISVEPFSQ